jgi:hypothetical protein
MALWVQTRTTTVLICFVMFCCYPIILEEKKLKMFVVFFGYPACPVKMIIIKTLESSLNKKSGNASFPL